VEARREAELGLSWKVTTLAVRYDPSFNAVISHRQEDIDEFPKLGFTGRPMDFSTGRRGLGSIHSASIRSLR